MFYREALKQFVASVELPRGVDGKRRRATVYGATKDEVRQKMEAIRNDVAAGVTYNAKTQSTRDYLARWLECEVKPNRALNTTHLYSKLLTRHVYPGIGQIPLVKLRAMDVQILLNDLSASPRVRQLVYIILRRAFSRACPPPSGLGLIARNPTDGVLKPVVARTETTVYTPAEVARLLASAKDDHFYPLFVLAFGTGARHGELLGLEWSDVSLDDGTAYIHQTMIEQDCHIVGRADVKSADSRRTVRLDPDVVAVLRAHRRRLLARGLSGSPWVFPNRKGRPVLQASVRRAFYRAARKAGVPVLRIHDTRHTAGTTMALTCDPKAVSEQLGHATVAFTFNKYVHRTEASAQKTAAALGNLIRGAVGG